MEKPQGGQDNNGQPQATDQTYPQQQQQPPPPYGYTGQPQQMYAPQGYPQGPYGQPGPSTVVVVQAAPIVLPQTNWMMPTAKIPGILLIIAAVLNFISFIAIGATSFFYAEFVIASLIYLVAGILGVVGAVRPQNSQGVAISCLVMSIAALIMAFAQIITRIQGIIGGQLLASLGGFWGNVGRVLLWASVALLLVALFAFAVSISLIVIPSKLLCSCCNGGNRNQTTGVVIQQHPQMAGQHAMTVQHSPAIYQAQQHPGMQPPPQQHPGMQPTPQQDPGMQQPITQVSHIS